VLNLEVADDEVGLGWTGSDELDRRNTLHGEQCPSRDHGLRACGALAGGMWVGLDAAWHRIDAPEDENAQ
jgi:hypothetical protein